MAWIAHRDDAINLAKVKSVHKCHSKKTDDQPELCIIYFNYLEHRNDSEIFFDSVEEMNQAFDFIIGTL